MFFFLLPSIYEAAPFPIGHTYHGWFFCNWNTYHVYVQRPDSGQPSLVKQVSFIGYLNYKQTEIKVGNTLAIFCSGGNH